MSTSGPPTILYQAVNLINGSKYIGITSCSLAKRRREHCSLGTKARSHQRFKRAIRKYGRDAFRFSVLKVCPSWDIAKQEERRLISVWAPTYNMTEGGEGILGYRHSEATKEKLRAHYAAVLIKPWTGLKRTAEQKRNISQAHIGLPGFWAGKTRDDDTKRKISATKMGKPRAPVDEGIMNIFRENMRRAAKARRKPVVCIDTGERFESARAACMAIGCSVSSVSSAIRRGLRIKGMTFAYEAAS